LGIRISVADSTILFVYLCVTLALGIWIGRGSVTLSRYLVAGRDLPWWAVLGSIIATETSAVTFLSVPGLALAQGGDFGFLQLSIGLILGRLIVVVWFLPSYFRDEIYTAYDILRDRFGGLTQRTSSMIFIITRTVADGLRLYLTALVLGQVTGFGLTPSVLVIGVATMIYATMGGIRSVIWNDCIQLVVYLAGAVVAVGVIADKLPGGFGQIVSYGQETDRFVVFHPEWTLFSGNLWAGIVGGLFLAIATHGTDQMMVQRYLCSRGLKQARWAVALSGPLVAAQFALFLLVGVALAAWFAQIGRPTPENLDEAFASFIVERMPVGLCGLTLAAVFSVAMSTLSSSLSSSASAVVNDFLRRDLPSQRDLPSERFVTGVVAEDNRLTRASRIWTVIFGLLQMSVAILVIHSPSLVGVSVVHQVLTVAGFSSGLIVGIFLLGKSQRRFAQRSGLIGMLAAFVVTLLLVIPNPWLERPLYGWWSALIASLVCYFVAQIVDRLFPLKIEPADE